MTVSRDRQARPDPLYRQLKPGPGHAADEVRANQRARLHGAMIELVSELGAEQVTVRRLTRLAGVSTRAFYGLFANADECLASTVDAVSRRLLGRAARQVAGSDPDERDLRALVRALVEEIAARPKAAALVLVEAFAGGQLTRERAAVFTGDVEELLTERLGALADAAPPRLLVLGIAAGIVRVARTTSLAGRAEELPALSGPLGDWVLALHDQRAPGLAAVTGSNSLHREAAPFPDEMDPVPFRSGHPGERERILAAVAKLAPVEGLDGLTVSRIRREAGVSRRAFDARFAGVSECLLASIEILARTAAARAESWSASAGSSDQHVYRMILALCAQAARNQELARLALLDVLSPGRAGLLCRERMIADAAAHLRRLMPGDGSATELATEASAAGLWRIAEVEVGAGSAAKLPAASPLLTFLVLAPARRPAR